MSSSGKGQSTVRSEDEIEAAWQYAQEGGRAGKGKVIVEGFVDFDYEITQLTVRHVGGTSFCEPIGHIQVDGDYRESWQPQPMSEAAKAEAQRYAEAVTDSLGGRGIFGVELFIKGDDVIFSEVSPRPHDTGMVTMIDRESPRHTVSSVARESGNRPHAQETSLPSSRDSERRCLSCQQPSRCCFAGLCGKRQPPWH